MIELKCDELVHISGGDRWGDGHDEKNHEDPNLLGRACTPVKDPALGEGWEICVVTRYKIPM
ncbi:hypothetical protein H5407_05410 [Mitsuaria sp. WAJ17]|uniref:hypothetical protein n=1 Tax=Mitsuaria sp. WAJ17 TaxID=2761452 RepID=UPI00160103F7|nr:hypothetical protein [Mitsuaria sp. WAJ17]MBB2484660.1 hypothetical protein [Mitsuaria sp. WAJ17]